MGAFVAFERATGGDELLRSWLVVGGGVFKGGVATFAASKARVEREIVC